MVPSSRVTSPIISISSSDLSSRLVASLSASIFEVFSGLFLFPGGEVELRDCPPRLEPDVAEDGMLRSLRGRSNFGGGGESVKSTTVVVSKTDGAEMCMPLWVEIDEAPRWMARALVEA